MGRGAVMQDVAHHSRRFVRRASLAAAIAILGTMAWGWAWSRAQAEDAGSRDHRPEQSSSGVWTPELPAEWRELSNLASQATEEALRAGAAAGVTGLDFRVRVWGDPGQGVFLLVADASLASKAATAGEARVSIEQEVRAALSKLEFQPVGGESAAGVGDTARDVGDEVGLVAAPGASGTIGSRLHVADDQVQSVLALRVEPGADAAEDDEGVGRVVVSAAACFFSQREPQHASRLCRGLLDAFEGAANPSGEESE